MKKRPAPQLQPMPAPVYQENQEKLQTAIKNLILQNLADKVASESPKQAWRQIGAQQILITDVTSQFMKRPSPAQVSLMKMAQGNVPQMNQLFRNALQTALNIAQDNTKMRILNDSIDRQEERAYAKDISTNENIEDENTKAALTETQENNEENNEEKNQHSPYSIFLLRETDAHQEKAEDIFSKMEKQLSQAEQESTAAEFFKEIEEDEAATEEETAEETANDMVNAAGKELLKQSIGMGMQNGG